MRLTVARTWLVTASSPNYCLHFKLGPTKESHTYTLANHIGRPCPSEPAHGFPMTMPAGACLGLPVPL